MQFCPAKKLDTTNWSSGYGQTVIRLLYQPEIELSGLKKVKSKLGGGGRPLT